MKPSALGMLRQLIAIENDDDPDCPAEILLDAGWAHIAYAKYRLEKPQSGCGFRAGIVSQAAAHGATGG